MLQSDTPEILSIQTLFSNDLKQFICKLNFYDINPKDKNISNKKILL